MQRVLITNRLLPEGFACLQQKFELTFPEKDTFTKEELILLLPKFDAMVSGFQYKIDRDILDAASKRVKIIANYGVGFNNIDIEYARQKGIVVTNTPDPVVEPTAELAFGLMHATARRIAECDRKLREGNQIKWGILENLGSSLYGKTLGIIGMGRIGQSLARRALAGGMQVIYHNRTRLDPNIEQHFQTNYASLEELLRHSDVVSLHTPLTSDTHHLINRHSLALMKPEAILINTSRGSVVDEQALAEALRKRQILAAGLDVYEQEPLIHESLLTLENVVLVPHIGTATVDARQEMGRFACENILRFFEGRTDIARVN